jgi:hypothetical protein
VFRKDFACTVSCTLLTQAKVSEQLQMRINTLVEYISVYSLQSDTATVTTVAVAKVTVICPQSEQH